MRDGTPLDVVGKFTGMGNLYVLDREKGTLVTRSDNYIPTEGTVGGAAGSNLIRGGSAGTIWFDAYDARSGERVWTFRTGAGCNSAPMTYQVDGRQYVALSCGGHASHDPQGGDAVIAFTLPD